MPTQSRWERSYPRPGVLFGTQWIHDIRVSRALLANNVAEFAEGAEEKENVMLAAQARHAEFALYQRLAPGGPDEVSNTALDSMYGNLAKAVELELSCAYQCGLGSQDNLICKLSAEFADQLQEAFSSGVSALVLDKHFFENATQFRKVDILYGQTTSASGSL